MKITANDLVAAVSNASGFCTVTTRTAPRLKGGKSNPYAGRVWNRTERCGMFGVSYQNAVQNQREREGHDEPSSFHAESLWKGAGKRVNRNIVENVNTGKLYMVMYPMRANGMPANRSTQWFVDDRPATDQEVAEIKQYMYQPSFNPAAKQETEEAVAWRTFCLENVEAVHCEGNTFEVSYS